MEIEEQTKKRDGGSDPLECPATVKRFKTSQEIAVDCTAAGDLDDDIVAWHSLDGETMDELMKFLDSDEGASSSSSSSSFGSPVKFIQNPYPSPLIFQSSCSYITINGNEESCGSSFSDWESSVMASIDVGVVRNSEKESESDEFCEWFQGEKDKFGDQRRRVG